MRSTKLQYPWDSGVTIHRWYPALCWDRGSLLRRLRRLPNFLADCNYKASREKAQLCQQSVKYLGLKIWALKNWCLWTVVLEKTLECPLDCKEIQPVNPKGNQFWKSIGRTDAEAETPILWPPDAKNWLIGKDSDAGKDWRQEEKGTTKDDMVEWYHWLDGHEFE